MIIVADTGPLLHLFWIEASLWALPLLPIHIVDEVWMEVDRFAPGALRDLRLVRVTPRGLEETDQLLARYRLDAGERAALGFALSQEDPGSVLVLCDERAARFACSELALSVTGSIGLIIESVRAERISVPEAERALRDLPGRGRLRVDPTLIEIAIGVIRSG